MSRQAVLLGLQHGKEHGSVDARLMRDSAPRAETSYADKGGKPYLDAYTTSYKRTYRSTIGRGWSRQGRKEGVTHGKEDAAMGKRKTLRPNLIRSIASQSYLRAYEESYTLAFNIERKVQEELLYRRELKARLTPETTLDNRELRAIELQQQKDQLRAKAQRELER